MDYIPEHEAWARSTLAGLELDFVIGSMHLLRGLPIDFSPPKLEHLINICGGTESFLEEYFDRMAHVAESGWADVIGHLDIFKKFDADLRTFPPRVVMPYAEQFLDRLAALPAENRPVLEINTAGCDRACAEPFPSAAIAAAAHVRGIELTLGSDSHAPDQVGRHGREATELLASCGVKGLTYFLAGERLRFAL